ncbi:hypothetical protein [Pseudorhodoplanes sp.]|uniref:hypothetical protein n=1 Tax=Pseudorhodoplanes sp. TaxID=1934341 RepID=UPI003D0C79AB
MEIESDDRAPLPLTNTGYSSGYVDASNVEALGGPVPFVLAWLDQEADSPAWRKREIAARQLSLF